MSVAVVTVAYGERHRAHLTEWSRAVDALTRQPDEVLVATDDLADALARLEPLGCPVAVVRAPGGHERHPQIYANDAIAASRSEWICRMDADDLIYPHALDPVDACDADVLCFGISVNGERDLLPPAVTAELVLSSSANLLFAGSPFRRSIWARTPGYRDMLYDDWAFWRDAAAAGATFAPTGTIDYEYRWGHASSTHGIDHDEEARRVLSLLH